MILLSFLLMVNSFGIFLFCILTIFKLYLIKIVKSLVKINILFYLLKIFYNNLCENKYTHDYKKILYKEIVIETNFYINDYILYDYEYEKVLGFKINLYIILKKNNKLIKKNIELIKKINLKRKYFYNTIINLLYKYSIYFKKIDFYLLNDIKAYLY